MAKAVQNAIHAHAAVARLLSDALGYQTDIRCALVTLKKGIGTDHISRAIMDYQTATAPAAVRRQVEASKGRGYDGIITPAVVRRSAADALREFLEMEIA